MLKVFPHRTIHASLTCDYPLAQVVNRSKRLALIIGNSNYGSFPTLSNPGNDALAIGEKLNSLGFAVDDDTLNVERTHYEMVNDIEEFTKRIHEDTTDIVFYYAGHGCSIG